MAVLVKLTAGWTKEVGPFTLRDFNGPVALTGMTVVLKLKGRASNHYVETIGDVRVADDQVLNKGQVFFKPDAADLSDAYSPYKCKWFVTDGAGDVVAFPNAEADTIEVYP